MKTPGQELLVREVIFMSCGTLDFNPFSTNVSLLYPLKTLENLRFSDVFRGYRSRTLVENGLIQYLYSDPLLLLLENLFAKFRELWVTVVMVYPYKIITILKRFILETEKFSSTNCLHLKDIVKLVL